MTDFVNAVRLQWESYGYCYNGIPCYNEPERLLGFFDLEWSIYSEEDISSEDIPSDTTINGILVFSWDVGFSFFDCSNCVVSPFLD